VWIPHERKRIVENTLAMWLHEIHINLLGRTGEKTIVLSKSNGISVNVLLKHPS
jgi:hypothetical protein